jgi:uncharacterized cofD-like protein
VTTRTDHEPAAGSSLDSLPRRAVALGGGNGLPAVLRGLRQFVASGQMSGLIAVVAMSDDGGSSGRLRRGRGLPPPGDVRNCLIALSEDEDLLAGLFKHRYDGEGELAGHNLGNLILAALSEQKGSFLKAVEVSSLVLRTAGRILPVTTEDVSLTAELDDGSTLMGESTIGRCLKRIRRVSLRPSTARPTPGVVESILDAELVVIGPGSLFTSVIPTLVLADVGRALRETRAVRVLAANMVSERGESSGLDLGDHLRILEAHAGGRVVDAIVVHEGPIAGGTLRRYEEEGATPLVLADEMIEGRTVVRGNLLAAGPKLRHEPHATAQALLSAWRACRPSGQGS